MKSASLFVLLTVFGITQPLLAQTLRQHSAHEHGAARLAIAAEGNWLEIELDSPAYNVFGFEHPPHTEAEQASVARASGILKEGGALFEFEPAVGCELKHSELTRGEEAHEEDHAADEEDHDHEEGHDHEASEDHQDVLVRWQFQCQNLKELAKVKIKVFESFDLLQDLDVTYLIDDSQGALELSPSQTQIQLK